METLVKKRTLSRTRRAARVIVALSALCLFIALFLPFFIFVSNRYTGHPKYKPFSTSMEKRHKNPPPDFHALPAKQWGHGIEQWYNDRFPFRLQAVTAYRDFHLKVLKTHVAREVPGLDGWVFRHGGDWAELDDYLGGFELTEDEKENWLTLFEGRRQWAAAHGIVYLQLITSVKAQIQCEKLPPAIRKRQGVGVGRQIREALEGTPLERNVIFVNDVLRDEVERGRDVFFPVDHHPTGFGEFLIYNKLNERIRSFFPQVGAIHLGKGSGTLPECWLTEDNRLAVRYPGETNIADSVLSADRSRKRYPYKSIVSKRPGEGLYLLMMNDSFMRFTLSSWNEGEGSVRFPFGDGIDRVASFIFFRATTGFMDYVISDRIPDIMIEQFPECRLNMHIIGFDTTMKRAAAFGRGRKVEASEVAACGKGKLYACAVLKDVTTSEGRRSLIGGPKMKPLSAELVCGNQVLGRADVYPGVKRAVFFSPFDTEKFKAEGGAFSVRLKDGRYSSAEIRYSVVDVP